MAKNLFTGTPLYEYCRRLVALKSQTKQRAVFDEVMSNKRIVDLIIYLNTEDQLREDGVDSDGNVIGTYSFATEFLSDGLKKVGEPFTLHDTGEFYNSFRVRVRGGRITITADPIKTNEQGRTENIYEKFGNFRIEGLTDKNTEVVRKFCLQYFQNYYRKILTNR